MQGAFREPGRSHSYTRNKNGKPRTTLSRILARIQRSVFVEDDSQRIAATIIPRREAAGNLVLIRLDENAGVSLDARNLTAVDDLSMDLEIDAAAPSVSVRSRARFVGRSRRRAPLIAGSGRDRCLECMK